MERPSIGRIVHFVSSNRVHHASIVTDVRRVMSGEEEVDLAVFTSGEDGCVSETGVLEDQKGQVVGSWHWPERIS
jgi:hypothetical protein